MIKKDIKPDVVTYNSLMDGYYLVKQVKNGKDIFNLMASMRMVPNVQSYNINHGFCKIC